MAFLPFLTHFFPPLTTSHTSWKFILLSLTSFAKSRKYEVIVVNNLDSNVTLVFMALPLSHKVLEAPFLYSHATDNNIWILGNLKTEWESTGKVLYFPTEGPEPYLYGILCTGNESRNKDTCMDKNDRVRCLIHKPVPTKSLPLPLSSTFGMCLSSTSLSHEIMCTVAWKKAVEHWLHPRMGRRGDESKAHAGASVCI